MDIFVKESSNDLSHYNFYNQMTYAPNTSNTLNTRIGALGLIAGSFLNMIRMGPIYLDQQIGFTGYPPESLAETVAIAQRTGYYISHAIVFVATPLFLIGFYALYKQLKSFAPSMVLTLSLFGFFIGQLLYVIGVVLHGLVLPEMADDYIVAAVPYQHSMEPLFELVHQMATSFGGLGFAFILISTGFLGNFLRLKFRVLGYIAMSVGMLAVIGYLTGILDLLLFQSFMLTAGFVTVMFVLYFIIGVAMFNSSKNSI